ncbi:MAG: hypothetical protein EZS28_015800 [Streblomastix strix]|uniref:DDE-1 domain-containing protein n=1 Tax=Streblomastix strix TaxID=222440 RepID=A0A5J4W2J0_9EUKA|nr:MAG: hypothetical protein EZS28_015800 [Streblomastix strix]
MPSRRWAQQLIHNSVKLNALKPTEVDHSRILASNQQNLTKVFNLLKEPYLKHKYPIGCINNLDETSLLVKKLSSVAFRICFIDQDFIPTQSLQLITSSATLLCVAADSFAFPSAQIFPQTLNLSSIKDFNNKQFLTFQNLNGWMTKQIFRYLMLTFYIPAIVERRKEFIGAERSLLMLNGQGSRLSIDVWKKCQENNIDGIVFLSLTTYLIQALDRGINAVYKQKLQKHAIMIKVYHDMEIMIQPFIDSIIQSAQCTLTVKTIKNGFKQLATVPLNNIKFSNNYLNIPQHGQLLKKKQGNSHTKKEKD